MNHKHRTGTWRRAIIALSNRLTRWRRIRVSPEQLLLLGPHCIQQSRCGRRVTDDLELCARCGQCPVADLLALCDEYGIRAHLVGGGRRALKIVSSPEVKAVIAIACERELCSGIMAAFPKPVLAISNQLRQEPCRDTTVDMASVRAAVIELLGLS